MQNLIAALKKLVTPREVFSLPQRPRSMATKALESEEIRHLANHIIKLTLWPEASYCKGWRKEIRTSLDNLAFKLCRYSSKKDEKRTIEKLWYGASDINKRLFEEMDDAYWYVMDDMHKEIPKIKSDPFVGKTGKNFAQIGYLVKQEKDANGSFAFSLWLKDTKIV